MRSWIMHLNYEPHQIDAYMCDLVVLFSNVDVARVRRWGNQRAALTQIDFELRHPRRQNTWETEGLPEATVYSGWIRDIRGDKIYSAMKDNVLPMDPSQHPAVGEFSYAAVQDESAVLMTDHYATHPIYYCQHLNGRWIASNDLRLILLSDSVPIEISNDACRQFLSQTVMVDENELAGGTTFFSGIYKLEPNNVLTIKPGGLEHRLTNCGINIESSAFSFPGMDANGHIEIFRETLNRCVHDRILAGAGGLMLSGGVDSNTVLGASLAVTSNSPPFTVNVSFKDADLAMSQDEQLVAAMFEQHNMPHRIIHADNFLRLLTPDDHCSFVDGPDPAANPLAKEACARVLLDQGVSFVMTGEGGDLVLGEAMHEWILDSILSNDGLQAVHRYISLNLEIPALSLKYWRMLFGAVFPAFGKAVLKRHLTMDARMETPAFLSSEFSMGRERSRTAGPNRHASTKFAYIGHEYMHSMLFPRAAYFDSLNVLCQHSHPYFDSRMLTFAFACAPHLQHDYRNLDRSNPYRTAKILARKAYQQELPAFVCTKELKTSYALMARRMFQNSACDLYRLTERPMLLHERGLVDQANFKRHLMAYIVATEDPNADLGIQYHYIRGVTDLETWLIRFSVSRAVIKERLKLQPLRQFDT